jgi:hypothetical protein
MAECDQPDHAGGNLCGSLVCRGSLGLPSPMLAHEVAALPTLVGVDHRFPRIRQPSDGWPSGVRSKANGRMPGRY